MMNGIGVVVEANMSSSQREALLQRDAEGLFVLCGDVRDPRASSSWPDPERTIQRRRLGTTSAEVSAVPSVNRSPSRSSNV